MTDNTDADTTAAVEQHKGEQPRQELPPFFARSRRRPPIKEGDGFDPFRGYDKAKPGSYDF